STETPRETMTRSLSSAAAHTSESGCASRAVSCRSSQLAHDEHRALGVLGDLGAHRAEQETGEPATSAAADHDHQRIPARVKEDRSAAALSGPQHQFFGALLSEDIVDGIRQRLLHGVLHVDEGSDGAVSQASAAAKP